MANFDAKIKLLVDAQEAYKAIAKFEKNIQKIADKAGALKFLREEKQKVRTAEKQLKTAVSVAAATKLYERRLREAARAGTFESQTRGKAAEAAKRVAEANKENLGILNRVNTLLGRINEQQREINRNAFARDKGRRSIAAANAELKRLRDIGFTEGQLKDIVESRDKLIKQVESNRFDFAKRTEAQLKRRIQLIQREVKEYGRLGKAARSISSPIQGRLDQAGSPRNILANAARSPVGGGAGFPGSPAYLKQQQAEAKKTEAALRRVATAAVRSPIRGGINFPGSPNYLKEQARLAKKAKKEQEALNNEVIKNAISSPTRGGVNFPGSPKDIAATERKNKALQRQGIQLRKLARSFDAVIKKSAKLNKTGGLPALPNSRLLGAEARGIQRLETPAERELRFSQRLAGSKKRNADIDKQRVADNKRLLSISKQLVKEEDKRAQVATKAAAKSPVRGGPAFPGSPGAKQAAANKRGRGFKRAEKLLTGVGFPLLFGGGVGTVVGGGLGGAIDALTGTTFGFSIALGALGQALDGVVERTRELGRALRDPTANVQQLVDLLPIVGTGMTGLYRQLEQLGFAEVVAADAARQLREELGDEQYDNLIEKTAELDNLYKDIAFRIDTKLAPALLGVFKLFGRIADFASQIIPGGGNGPSPERPKQEPNPALVQLRQDIFTQQQDLAGDRVNLLEQELTARRDTLAVERALIPIQEAQNKIKNLDIRIDAEANESRRQELQQEQELLKIKLKGLEAAKENARIRAERQIEDDVFSQLQRQINALKQIEQLQVTQKTLDDGTLAGIEQRSRNAEGELKITVALIEKRKEIARQRITEQDVLTRTLAALDTELALAKQRKETTDRQIAADTARFNILQRTFVLQQQLANIQARQSVETAALSSPDAQLGNLMRGWGFFTETIRTAEKATLEFQQRYELLGEQLKTVQAKLAEPGVGGKEKEALERDETALQNQLTYLDVYGRKLVDAQIKQARFNDALALTTPITESLVFGLRDVVTGTKTAEEAFASFLNTVADMLLKTAAEMISTYIAIGIARQFAGLGGGATVGSGGAQEFDMSMMFRESGGRTMANRPYIVGEKGAELFVPGKTGTIVPAEVFEATRQAVAGNGPEGGDSDAFAQNSVALGNTATTTKENTLVREMSMRGNEAIDIRYDATVINDVSYVSEEQFQAGLKAAVAQSKASMFRDLKNKPSARAGIGI